MGILNRTEYDRFRELRKAKELPAGVRTFTEYLEFLERTVPGFRAFHKGSLGAKSQVENGSEKV